MSSPHRPVDHRSGLVLDTHELGRHAGGMKVVATTVDAPSDLGIDVIGVPAGSPVVLDLMLESVIEGVLVTGTAGVTLRGECVRCLEEISRPAKIDLQELYVYASSEASDDEVSRLRGDQMDLEPLLRDGVVLDLPFQPLCRPDCAGLCVTCGASLNADPGHVHPDETDPRWEALLDLERMHEKNYDVDRTFDANQ